MGLLGIADRKRGAFKIRFWDVPDLDPSALGKATTGRRQGALMLPAPYRAWTLQCLATVNRRQTHPGTAAHTTCAPVHPHTQVQPVVHGACLPRRSSNDLLGSSVGVFVGCIWTEYGELLASHQEQGSLKRGGGGAGSSQVVTGNGLAFMAGRVSYTFGLTGGWA